MERRMLRMAAWGDREAMVALKTAYIRHLYQGFVPGESLQLLDPTPYSQIISNSMTGNRKIILSENEKKINGYVIYGANPDEDAAGELEDMAILPGTTRQAREELLMYAIEDLATRGIQIVRTWVLRDNFRVRFLFEQCGFRCEGHIRHVQERGNEFQYISYVYRVPDRMRDTMDE